MVGSRTRSASCTAPSSSMSVIVQSSRPSVTARWSAMPKVRSKSEKRSPPPTASDPTAAPATTRSPPSASRSTRSRSASRCSTVNTSGDASSDAAVLHRTAEPAIVNLMVQYPTTVDRAFAALADPTRRAVLERLGAGSATISELAEPFGMSLTGMKKHIRLLEEANLVATEKVGRARRCALVPYAFEGITTWLQRLDRFAQVVQRTKGAR